jgi:hypothetical protein
MHTHSDEIRDYLADLKREALQIDAETAEVTWCYAVGADPYGIERDLPPEYQQVGREYYARRPTGEIWVWFGDLPDATRKRLLELHERKLAFPAGLEELLHLIPNNDDSRSS